MRLRSDTEAMYENSDEEEDDEDYDYNPKMEKVTTLLAIAAGVVICVIVIILAVKVFGGMQGNDDESSSPIMTEEQPTETPGEQTVIMPDVKGKTREDARNTLAEYGFAVNESWEESDTIDVGVVISASVEAGSQVAVGSTVTLTVSAGPAGVEVPTVTGISYEEADSQLVSLGFAVTKMETYSDTVEAGIVAAQTPAAGSKVPKGTNITVTVSLGKEETKVLVPNLMGLTEEDGTFKAIEAGLQISSVSYVYVEADSEYAEGEICYQSYSQGSWVEPGTGLEIKVSKGPEKRTYKCNASITAPTAEEAPDYSGGAVKLKLVTDDGTVLLDTTVTTFPQSVNSYGLTASGGTLTMTYTVTTESTTTTDENGNQVTVPGTTEEKDITRRIEFTVE